MLYRLQYTFILIITLFLFSEISYGIEQNSKKTPPNIDEQKIENYLRLKSLVTPKELSVIQYELRRNVLDIILVTNKYKLLIGDNIEVINMNYKAYYDFHIFISERIKSNYEVTYEIRDWLDIKKTKKLTVKLNRFNVLSDFRMGIYELFYGKEYIRRNRDKLLQYSNIRITKIREDIEKQSSLENSNSASSGKKKTQMTL